MYNDNDILVTINSLSFRTEDDVLELYYIARRKVALYDKLPDLYSNTVDYKLCVAVCFACKISFLHNTSVEMELKNILKGKYKSILVVDLDLESSICSFLEERGVLYV